MIQNDGRLYTCQPKALSCHPPPPRTHIPPPHPPCTHKMHDHPCSSSLVVTGNKQSMWATASCCPGK